MRDIRFRDSLPDLVGKLFRHVARVHNRALRPFELSAVHAHVLAALWLSGPMTMGELQAGLALGSSTATGAIDRMERLGLVRRSDVAGDRRAVRLEPANWTARRREAVLDALAKTEDDAFSGLTRAERRELARLLSKAIESIAQVDRGDDE